LLAVGRAAAASEGAIRLGLVTPRGPLSDSIRHGAEFGQQEADLFAKLFGRRVELLVRSPETEPDCLAAGLELVRGERVSALIGGTSDAAAEALVKAARQASSLFLNVGALSSRLRGPLLDPRSFHVHPGVATLVDAAGLWLLEQGRGTRWGLVVAESAYGSEVEAAVASLVASGSSRVVVRERLAASFDDWPALLLRLRDAQPEAVLVGLDPEPTRALLAAYPAAELPSELACVPSDPHFALRADPASLAGIWPLAWHQGLERYSARELNGRFSRGFQRPLDGAGWAAWAAVKLVVEAAVRAGSLDADALLEFMERRLAFDGHKGAALSFRAADRELGQPLYIAKSRPAGGPGGTPALEVVDEVKQESLDAAGRSRQERA
jgi:ABC-type branched-subunit amino acid transport system substrate-binding protein